MDLIPSPLHSCLHLDSSVRKEVEYWTAFVGLLCSKCLLVLEVSTLEVLSIGTIGMYYGALLN